MTARLQMHCPAPFPRPSVRRPMSGTMVCAGFPSPADDHQESPIDLNEELIRNEPATFFYRAIGHSGEGNFVRSGDIAVVDRSLTPVSGDLVVAVIDGEKCLKLLCMERGRVWLASANREYPDIEINTENTLMVEGVVTHTIHCHSHRRR